MQIKRSNRKMSPITKKPAVIALAALTGVVLFATSCKHSGGCPAYGKHGKHPVQARHF